jgi:1-acyl-sn-glycerol-3-phosphate acyltransferase
MSDSSEDTAELPQCAALTRSGRQCRNRVLPGERYCRVHIDQAESDAQADAPAPPAMPAAEPAAMPATKPEAEPDPEHTIMIEPNEQPESADHEEDAGVEVEVKTLETPVEQRGTQEQELAIPLVNIETRQVANDVRSWADRMHDQTQQQNDTLAAAGFFGAELLRVIADNLEQMASGRAQEHATQQARDLMARTQNVLLPDFWADAAGLLLYQLREQVNFVRRRLSGEYQVDAYGLDREIIALWQPFLLFLYRVWWRVETEGLEHVPADGAGMLVANHSGVLPWDGAMIATAVHTEHPAQNQRVVRNLFLNWFSEIPGLAPLFVSLGQMTGVPENAVRLLQDGELVCTFPEGAKGIGKPFRDRYQLQRFGRGGSVQIALRTGAPLIPVAVVGAEETYPLLANNSFMAKLLGLPYFPITLTFPWFGPLGMIPLPSRWSITFCPPVDLSAYSTADADDPLIVEALNEEVRMVIQETINRKLGERKRVF